MSSLLKLPKELQMKMRMRFWTPLAIFTLAFSISSLKAQTLPSDVPPCHSLRLSVPPNTGCFDDVDRDGEFQYNRGDRAFTAKGWIQYQWNMY